MSDMPASTAARLGEGGRDTALGKPAAAAAAAASTTGSAAGCSVGRLAGGAITVVSLPLPCSAAGTADAPPGGAAAAGEGRSLMSARGCTTELRPEEPPEQEGAGASADAAGAVCCCCAAEGAGRRDSSMAAMAAGRRWVHTEPSSPAVNTQPLSGRMSTWMRRGWRAGALGCDGQVMQASQQTPTEPSVPGINPTHAAHLGNGGPCNVGLAATHCAGRGLAGVHRQAVQVQGVAVGGHRQQRE